MIQEIKKMKSGEEKERKIKGYPMQDMFVEENVLYLLRKDNYDREHRCVVIPQSYIPNALALAHSVEPAGHGGVNATFARCKRFAFWPGMKLDVIKYCSSCPVCTKYKVKPKLPAPVYSYPEIGSPFERVHMDLVGPLSIDEEGHKYIMTVIDVMTRYLITVPLKTKEAKEVARCFYEKVICLHGMPEIIVTDNGREFVNEVFDGIMALLKIKHLRTTPYHPAANGVIERPNGTLINILRTLCEENRRNWNSWLPIATYAYNTAYHRIVKDSPFFLMYLRDARPPFETLHKKPVPLYSVDDYKTEALLTAQKVYRICQKYLEEGRLENERKYKRTKIVEINIGDRVYLKNHAKPGESRKLQAPYEGPYRVIDKVSDVVLKVKRIKGGPVKSIHTNNVRVVPEYSLTRKEVPNIRQAFIEESNNTNMNMTSPITWLPLPSVSSNNNLRAPSPTSDGETEEESKEPNEHASNAQSEVESEEEELERDIRQPDTPILPQQRSLRSNTVPPEYDFVMDRPIEYKRN